mmetsp:Transcript_21998/g.61226  ORF Transcript_21998/g.61226 Transcript_21998/m.61226 type:complete len:162 (+) Transcript_21998:821-1306(+)
MALLGLFGSCINTVGYFGADEVMRAIQDAIDDVSEVVRKNMDKIQRMLTVDNSRHGVPPFRTGHESHGTMWHCGNPSPHQHLHPRRLRHPARTGTDVFASIAPAWSGACKQQHNAAAGSEDILLLSQRGTHLPLLSASLLGGDHDFLLLFFLNLVLLDLVD